MIVDLSHFEFESMEEAHAMILKAMQSLQQMDMKAKPFDFHCDGSCPISDKSMPGFTPSYSFDHTESCPDHE